jgi:tetratricopeptide (TPR) repeat protein
MRHLFLLIFISFVSVCSSAQTMPSQKEIQKQMQEAMNVLNQQVIDLEKQIADAKRNNEDSLTIKDLEGQAAMLKKQVQMMSGLNKSVAGISKKTFEQAVEKKPIVPKKDLARIQSIPDKILSDSGLYSLIKRIHIDVEKLIPAAEKTGAARIYQETKKNFSSAFAVNNAAAGCWLYGHWEKALWLSGKACLDSMADPDNLNNYAAYLTMIGGEHAAIPILRYLNKKYPGNSTVLNNIGQAWFGLGDIPAAKKFLDGFPDSRPPPRGRPRMASCWNRAWRRPTRWRCGHYTPGSQIHSQIRATRGGRYG